jgi:plasmid stabilization system protein ParE
MSGKPVEFHPEALSEAEAAVAWYGERSLRAGEAFVSDLERGVAAISEAPHRWPRFEAGCRRFPLRRLPYLLIYREKPSSIEVLAVAHGRRRPGYWRPRSHR